MYFTYVLFSQKDGKHYIGFTPNLSGRVQQHHDGNVASTRYRRPLILVYYEACQNKQKAIAREKYFKTGYGRRFLKNRI